MFNDLIALYRVVAIATVGHQAATILWRHVYFFGHGDSKFVQGCCYSNGSSPSCYYPMEAHQDLYFFGHGDSGDNKLVS